MKIKAVMFLSLIFFSCSGNKNVDKKFKVKDEIKISNESKYYYEPNNSILSGTIKDELFWGAPNFGEDTTVDEKEICFILYLDKPINIYAESTDEINGTLKGINKIQLVSKRKLDSFKNKNVIVKGQLFAAHNGHHHTDVLLRTHDISEKAR
ncbi:MAG: DUF4431 domain-containing protein [Pedobacter sp.]|nr:MAG: DUF4431 domain-containing protein [Pedobacter sp.]